MIELNKPHEVTQVKVITSSKLDVFENEVNEFQKKVKSFATTFVPFQNGGLVTYNAMIFYKQEVN